MPDSEDPEPREAEPHHDVNAATPLSAEEFHERADLCLQEIMDKMEALQEGKDDLELDFASGVMNIVFPPNGTYVLNKQPPNKQIWLSSPITGPKRFDWVMAGESMDQKEGSGVGDWVYVRDGTSLSGLLRKELGITIGMAEEIE
ncbi:Mitochondrial matrix iron chaperone [Elasticomyces elasticus]|nr:Mitochondrial matrix iron chaperone [Elasticomyces elasticus]